MIRVRRTSAVSCGSFPSTNFGGADRKLDSENKEMTECIMKEQEEIALKAYERLGAVHAAIQRLGYPSKSTLYRWYERRNVGLENKHGHTAEMPEKAIISATGRIIQGIHQLNSNTRYCAVALSSARM